MSRLALKWQRMRLDGRHWYEVRTDAQIFRLEHVLDDFGYAVWLLEYAARTPHSDVQTEYSGSFRAMKALAEKVRTDA